METSVLLPAAEIMLVPFRLIGRVVNVKQLKAHLAKAGLKTQDIKVNGERRLYLRNKWRGLASQYEAFLSLENQKTGKYKIVGRGYVSKHGESQSKEINEPPKEVREAFNAPLEDFFEKNKPELHIGKENGKPTAIDLFCGCGGWRKENDNIWY